MNNYSQYKKCVFTVITGGYDNLMEPDPIALQEQWDFLCFTDNPNLQSSIWDICYIKPEDMMIECPKRRANAVLMNYTDYLSSEYDICLYIDGNIQIKKSLNEFLSEFNYNPEEHDMMISDHPIRNCIYQEANAIIELRKDDRTKILDHLKVLRDFKYPRNNGLFETGVIVITRSSEKTKEIFQDWWSNYMSFPSKRDQMSLNFTIWETNNQISILSHSAPAGSKGKDIRAFNKYLEVMPHGTSNQKTSIPPDVIIFENTPYRSDKNLVTAYNSFMEILPESGWALFRDADTLLLDPFYGEVFERAIRNNPDTGCFTCLTNRIGNKIQLHDEYPEDDIKKHREICNKLKSQNYNKYEDFQFNPQKGEALSGMVMLLSKQAWKQVGGFKKSTLPVHSRKFKNLNILGVDNQLHKDLHIKKIPLKIIKEMYIYHWYRGGGDDKSHLDVETKYVPPMGGIKSISIKPKLDARKFSQKRNTK